MSIQIEPLPTPTGVASGQDALFHIPGGRLIHAAWFQISEATNNVTLASGNLLGDIQCVIDQTTFRQATGVQANHIQSCNDKDLAAKTTGIQGNPGYGTLFPIYFADPSRKDPAQIRASALPLNGRGAGGLDIKIRMGALTTPVITGWYEYEPITTPINLGVVQKWVRKTYQSIGSVNQDTTIPVGDLYQAMHFFPTTDNKFVYQLDLKAGSRYMRRELTYLQNQATLLGRGLNPDVNQNPVFDVIFDYDDPVDQWLRSGDYGSMEFKALLNAASAGGNQDVVSVRVAPL